MNDLLDDSKRSSLIQRLQVRQLALRAELETVESVLAAAAMFTGKKYR